MNFKIKIYHNVKYGGGQVSEVSKKPKQPNNPQSTSIKEN